MNLIFNSSELKSFLDFSLVKNLGEYATMNSKQSLRTGEINPDKDTVLLLSTLQSDREDCPHHRQLTLATDIAY